MTEASVHDDVSLEALIAQVADEFLDRQKRGERPDVEECAARYPEAAPLLRKVLAALELVGLSPAGAAAGPEEGLTGCLGDYRILREVGRGGMGVVYEARQLSLKRRVALKVLPFAATLDPKRLQRFHHEAQAAAQLHHTNIVPVFAVGCERGVHYYAMQFIDGLSLESVIAQWRGPGERAEDVGPRSAPTAEDRPLAPEPLCLGSPAPAADTRPIAGLSTERPPRDREFFHTVARLGEQAALALDYAHELGVVHRDIKPANLLVDLAGNLWVTDFGLAHMQSEQSLTLTGDLIGTLRYMSPEQALARRAVVDHRTDIYSLGVTLYELLTLRPPFAGADRQELLRQIAFEEPRSPRRINPAVPAELETIVLKALEKNPADRYPTAEALAEDLRRYRMNEPIRARRSSLVQRARKVVRRHPGVTVTATAALLIGMLLGAAGLAVNNHLVRQEQLRTQDALNRADEQKEVAQAVRDFLRALLSQADPRAQAEARRRDGESSESRPNPRIRELLDRAAFGLALDRIEGQFPGQPLVQAEILKTIGEAYAGIGEYELAISHLQRARDLQARELAPDHPDALATMNSLARSYLDDRRLPEATGLFERVFGLRSEKLGRDHPDTLTSMNDLARCYFVLRRRPEALKLREEIVALRKARLGPAHPDTLASMNNLANSYAAARRFADARQLHAETLALRKASLGEDDPDTLQSMNNLANCHAALGQYAEALQLHQKTLALRRSSLGEDHPDTLQSISNVAIAYEALGRYAEALKFHEETLARRQAKLRPDHPDTLKTLNSVAWLLANCPDPKLRNPEKALELARQAVDLAPKRGEFHNTLGAAYCRVGDWKNAVEALTRSMTLRKGGDSTDWFFLAMAHWHLGDKQQAREWYDRAVEWMEKHPPGDEEQRRDREELRRFRAEAAELLGIEKD